MWYRYETHMQSCQGSKCGKSPCADMVRAYHAAGYAGAVLTDHFIWGNTAIPRDLPWEERMQGYYDAYLSAKPVADELDFDLIFGFEHQYGHNKEILVYGIGVDFLKANADIPDITLAEFCDRIHAAGGYISHAHPFRFRPYMVEGFFPADTSHCDARSSIIGSIISFPIFWFSALKFISIFTSLGVVSVNNPCRISNTGNCDIFIVFENII